MRFVPQERLHPIIGQNVQVKDLEKGLVITLYAGLEAWKRAEARCAELNQKEKGNG